jgi:hypothetical protein
VARNKIPTVPGLKPETLVEMVMSGRSQATVLAYRRYIVAHLALHTGLTYDDIAKHVEDIYGIQCNAGMIKADIVSLRKRWADTAGLTTEKLVERELTVLAEVEDKVQELYTRGEVKEYTECVLKIQKRRSTLLGLDKPLKISVHKPPVYEMTDVELQKLLADGEKAVEEMATNGPSKNTVN